MVAPPDLLSLLGPILPALPSASVSTEPAVALLPLLSPILRQRVQLFSASSADPWLRLLCYDPGNAAKLAQLVRSGSLEPHPVSGEVEVDWERAAHTSFRRLDAETLQAMTLLPDLGLAFQLVHCDDGWKVGEVLVSEGAQFPGSAPSIPEAESLFSTKSSEPPAPRPPQDEADDDDDDDGYWDRYDATPNNAPPSPFRPPPTSNKNGGDDDDDDDDDDYYAQYDQVQPAMDPHGPEEEHQQPTDPHSSWTFAELDKSPLAHPRPDSSASSNAVARLEASAGRQEQNEFGVKQHVSRTIRSLYTLSLASGIQRDEFERIVRTELDLLGMMED